MFKLLTSYLNEQHIRVKTDGKFSSSRLLDHGVTQDSILVPLLFYFMLTIFLMRLILKVLFFFDDTNLYLSHSNINSLISLL